MMCLLQLYMVLNIYYASLVWFFCPWFTWRKKVHYFGCASGYFCILILVIMVSFMFSILSASELIHGAYVWITASGYVKMDMNIQASKSLLQLLYRSFCYIKLHVIA